MSAWLQGRESGREGRKRSIRFTRFSRTSSRNVSSLPPRYYIYWRSRALTYTNSLIPILAQTRCCTGATISHTSFWKASSFCDHALVHFMICILWSNELLEKHRSMPRPPALRALPMSAGCIRAIQRMTATSLLFSFLRGRVRTEWRCCQAICLEPSCWCADMIYLGCGRFNNVERAKIGQISSLHKSPTLPLRGEKVPVSRVQDYFNPRPRTNRLRRIRHQVGRRRQRDIWAATFRTWFPRMLWFSSTNHGQTLQGWALVYNDTATLRCYRDNRVPDWLSLHALINIVRDKYHVLSFSFSRRDASRLPPS